MGSIWQNRNRCIAWKTVSAARKHVGLKDIRMIYDLTKSFEFNSTYGPFWEGELPKFPKTKRRYALLGQKVNSLFGVSACPLTHGSRAVRLMSQLGYDIITYRSVRSMEWHGQKYPHLRYVDIPKQLLVNDLVQPVIGSEQSFSNQEVSIANSFGIQSLKPEYWQADFEVAKQSLQSG